MAGQVDVHWADDPTQLERFITRIEGVQAGRINLDRVLIRLYYGRPLSVPAMDVRRPSQSLQDIENVKAAGFSLVREVIDAAAALVVRMPSIKVLPIGQQFKLQRGAKLMSRYLNGVFYENNAKEIAPALFNDACTTRLGALKWYYDDTTNKIKCERLNSLWLLWDDAEGPDPKSLYYVAPASKRFLISQYPEHESEIKALPHWEPVTVPAVEFSRWHEVDRVKVTEAWTLPMGDKPGRHIIQVGKNINLLDEEWEYSKFPVVAYRWQHGYRTWGGRPLAEVILPYQIWTNRIMRTIAEASKASIPKLLAHELSEVGALNDKIMDTIVYRGPNPPVLVAPNAISEDLWRLRDTLKAEAYEEAGVNPAIAQGTTSDNLKSAPAQRERMDIASTRLIHPTQRFETFWKECAEVVIMLSAQADSKLKASVPMGSWMREIPWDDIEVAEGQAVVEVTSTAALPLTVGGRLDFVNDLLQMKDDQGKALISAKDGLKLLAVPDTESVLDRETASQELADKQVEAALWEGEYMPPEPIQDVQLLIDTASKELMRALQNGSFPEANIELCRRLIAQAKLLMPAEPVPPPAAGPAPLPPQPMGPPGPPPMAGPPPGPQPQPINEAPPMQIGGQPPNGVQ